MIRPQPVAELVEHLMRRLYGASFTHGLKPAQWNALRYFGRANESARTVTAFARFHATTKSSASQTIGLLVRKGFVKTVPAPDDSRSKRISLTPRGRSLLETDPLTGLTEALASLDERQLMTFVEVVDILIRRSFVDPKS